MFVHFTVHLRQLGTLCIEADATNFFSMLTPDLIPVLFYLITRFEDALKGSRVNSIVTIIILNMSRHVFF